MTALSAHLNAQLSLTQRTRPPEYQPPQPSCNKPSQVQTCAEQPQHATLEGVRRQRQCGHRLLPPIKEESQEEETANDSLEGVRVKSPNIDSRVVSSNDPSENKNLSHSDPAKGSDSEEKRMQVPDVCMTNVSEVPNALGVVGSSNVLDVSENKVDAFEVKDVHDHESDVECEKNMNQDRNEPTEIWMLGNKKNNL